MRDFDKFDDMVRRSQRSHRRFVALNIAAQIAVVVGVIWLLTHPEAARCFAGRIVAGFIAQ